MRLDKFLSECGYTRKNATALIKAKDVLVNGKVVIKKDEKINENSDEVVVCGKKLVYQKYIYIMLNKPKGVLSATEDKTQSTIISLLPQHLQTKNLFPVGRLDKDTTGLIIITNDGDFCHRVISPKNNVNKTYYFVLADKICSQDVEKLKNGVTLADGLTTKTCEIEMLTQNTGYITITEGKYHQVRRMFASTGNKVVELDRVSEGNIILDKNLKRGQWRFLTDKEVENIY